jgi:hypothetical protein
MAACTAAEYRVLYWSDPLAWRDGPVPEEGAVLEIFRDFEMIYDIGTSPVFESISVYGKLTFAPG